MTFMKADRYLKPSWPQHLQPTIFTIKGAVNLLNLPSGEDFGGLKRTLAAYCATYGCKEPVWTVTWHGAHAPEFRLLSPGDNSIYTSHQLLAILRALRFNDYFRSLSFKDVDFSALLGRNDLVEYNDSIAHECRTGIFCNPSV
jgi:hypothetical protein